MAGRVYGNIKDGFNVGERGVLTITALANNSASGLIINSEVNIDVPAGAYDFNLIAGNYTAFWFDLDLKRGTVLGSFTITNSTSSSLFSLINIGTAVGLTVYVNDLSDVDAPSPSIGDTIVWDGEKYVSGESGGGGSGNSYFPGGWQ